jgi:hypothetical protein
MMTTVFDQHLCVARTHLIALARMLKGLQGYGVGERRLARLAGAECCEDILDSLQRQMTLYPSQHQDFDVRKRGLPASLQVAEFLQTTSEPFIRLLFLITLFCPFSV